jgi:hypothetical protein
LKISLNKSREEKKMQKSGWFAEGEAAEARAALLNCISALGFAEILKSPLHGGDVSSILDVLPQVLLIAFVHVL